MFRCNEGVAIGPTLPFHKPFLNHSCMTGIIVWKTCREGMAAGNSQLDMQKSKIHNAQNNSHLCTKDFNTPTEIDFGSRLMLPPACMLPSTPSLCWTGCSGVEYHYNLHGRCFGPTHPVQLLASASYYCLRTQYHGLLCLSAGNLTTGKINTADWVDAISQHKQMTKYTTENG